MKHSWKGISDNTEDVTTMEEKWVWVKSRGDCAEGSVFYIHKEERIAKQCNYKSRWSGYHDEERTSWDSQIISVESLFEEVYPNAAEISNILRNTKQDYSGILRQLAKKNGKHPSLFVPVRKQDLFPDSLNANPYVIKLYEHLTGWNDEQHMVSVDEARGICWHELSIEETHNSHGTDVDYTYKRTPEMPLEQMADYIQEQYNRDVIEKQSEKRQQYYIKNATDCVPKLRSVGQIRQIVFETGKKVIQDWLPNFTVQELRYAAGNTALFAADGVDGRKYVIKLNCVSKEKTSLEIISRDDRVVEKIPGMVPVWKLVRLPLTDTEDIFVTIMPELEPIQKIKQRDTTTFGFIGLHHRDNCSGVNDRQVIPIALDVARSLKEIHERGSVHNDVKPENILGKKEADQVTWCLGDFSSMRLVADQYQGIIHGTLAYMSPELRDRRPFSYSSDVYSWGITMLALSANCVPDGVPDVQIRISRDKSVPEIGYRFFHTHSWWEREERIIRFWEILKKALQPDPSRRFSDGSELVAALEAMERDEQTFTTAMKWEREDIQVAPPATPDPVKTAPPVAPKPVSPEQENKKQGQPSMEPFVDALYNRLDQAGKLKLYVIMQNAINEMHNSGIIAGLDAEMQKRVHDPDPEVRVREKTVIAKAVGKSCVIQSSPMPQNGILAFLTVVKYNPNFVNSICLCIQGGIEGLYMAGIHTACGGKMVYNVRIEHDPGVSVEPLVKLLQDLDGLYAEYQISILNESATSTSQPVAPIKQESKPKENTSEDAKKKKNAGFFARLFGRR